MCVCCTASIEKASKPATTPNQLRTNTTTTTIMMMMVMVTASTTLLWHPIHPQSILRSYLLHLSSSSRNHQFSHCSYSIERLNSVRLLFLKAQNICQKVLLPLGSAINLPFQRCFCVYICIVTTIVSSVSSNLLALHHVAGHCHLRQRPPGQPTRPVLPQWRLHRGGPLVAHRRTGGHTR